jgi:hypothetical protein
MKTRTNLYKRYFHSSNEKLIAIIENAHLYRNETVAIARELLEGRALEMEFVINCARSLMHEKLETYFGSFDIYNDEFEIPTSEFLTEEEVLEIFDEEYHNYLNNRNSFRLDMSQYQAA